MLHHHYSNTKRPYSSLLLLPSPIPSPKFPTPLSTHPIPHPPFLPLLLPLIPLPDPLLHPFPLSNPLNPRHQMRQFLHLLLRHATKLPTFHPRPSPDVSNRVLALPIACKILAGFAGIFAAEMDLENAVNAQSFVPETVDRVGDFFLGVFAEVVELALMVAVLAIEWGI